MNQNLKHALNGIFSIYKPKGITSRQAATQVQQLLSKQLWQTDEPWKLKRKDRVKLGMGGILDPMAEGVLVLGLGSGCKQLESYLKGTKEYIATGQLGTATDTYDADGKVVMEAPTQHINKQLLEAALKQFQGDILQRPPLYSGLKMQGKRLYEYAREGRELPTAIIPRQVTLYQSELVNFDPIKLEFVVSLEVSGGFYVRSLIHDMGQVVESCAHMTRLVRTRQGPFTVDTSLHLLEDRADPRNDETNLKAVLDALVQT
ncbi:unnamed protein product [Absidia cylindrospora]